VRCARCNVIASSFGACREGRARVTIRGNVATRWLRDSLVNSQQNFPHPMGRGGIGAGLVCIGRFIKSLHFL